MFSQANFVLFYPKCRGLEKKSDRLNAKLRDIRQDVLPFIHILLVAILCMEMGCRNHQHPDKKIFRYNELSGIASLDPAFARNQSVMWPIHQLYNTLVEVDDQLHIQPSLAYRWELSPDRTRFTFYLRGDVFFHDDPAFPSSKGRKLTAADVAYSFNRIIAPKTASPGAWIFNDKINPVKPFEALSDSVFQLTLARPFLPMLGILSMQYCSIIPKEAVEKYGNDFRRQPVGTGPFQLVAWQEGQALILKKNPHYFERDSIGNRLPYLDGIAISFYPSKATEFLEFTQHRLDFINDIDASFKDEVMTRSGELKAEWKGRMVLQKHPYLNIEYLGILVDSSLEEVKLSPLRIKLVRQAINYGINRKKMMLYLRNSIGTAAESGFVPTGLPSFDANVVKGYEYNPSKTAALLAEAGFPGGIGLPEIRLSTIPVYANLAAFIASELEQSGIKVKIETSTKSVLLDLTAHSKAQFFRGSWIADYPDAENFLGVFYGKNPAPPNYTRFRNEAFDALYEKASGEMNDSVRYGYYRKMDQLIMDEAPVVPLWYDMALHLVQPDVSHFRPNALNLLELRRVCKTP